MLAGAAPEPLWRSRLWRTSVCIPRRWRCPRSSVPCTPGARRIKAPIGKARSVSGRARGLIAGNAARPGLRGESPRDRAGASPSGTGRSSSGAPSGRAEETRVGVSSSAFRTFANSPSVNLLASVGEMPRSGASYGSTVVFDNVFGLSGMYPSE